MQFSAYWKNSFAYSREGVLDKRFSKRKKVLRISISYNKKDISSLTTQSKHIIFNTLAD